MIYSRMRYITISVLKYHILNLILTIKLIILVMTQLNVSLILLIVKLVNTIIQTLTQHKMELNCFQHIVSVVYNQAK
jgi:hypothetical protein